MHSTIADVYAMFCCCLMDVCMSTIMQEELLLRDFREYQQKQQKKISEAHRK